MIYNILDKYIMNDFSEEIVKNLNNNKNNVIFDIGCFKGNFSRTLKNKLNSKLHTRPQQNSIIFFFFLIFLN